MNAVLINEGKRVREMKGVDLERYSILAVAKPDERTDLRHGELLCYRTRR